MSLSMPEGDFKFLSKEEFDSINWLEQNEDQSIGYIIVCDLEYPANLHESHNDYPLAPERLTIDAKYISQTQVKIRSFYNMPRRIETTKLMPNLMGKTKYCTHYLNLKFYIEHGLQLTKIHSVISFKQSKWLAPYIEFNQRLRAKCKNDFEKDFLN